MIITDDITKRMIDVVWHLAMTDDYDFTEHDELLLLGAVKEAKKLFTEYPDIFMKK